MARTFTTLFSYNGENYTAVISQLNGTTSIYVPDESLHDILPAGKATYQTAQGLKIDTPTLSPAQRLILSVLTSIEGPDAGILKTIKEEN